MEYAIGARIVFSGEINDVLKREKERLVVEYGSKYKSEPHITLWRDRRPDEKIPGEVFPRLISDLRELRMAPFVFSLLGAKAIHEGDRHRCFYVMDVSNKDRTQELARQISAIAVRCGLSVYPEIDPHITIGAVDFDHPQPDLGTIQDNLQSLTGREIAISSFVVVLDRKKEDDEMFRFVDRVEIPLR